MELKGEFEVKSDRRTVSSFISDIDQVTSIIPEVQSAEKLNEISSKLVVKAGKSAIKGKFNLLLELKQITEGEDIDIYARGSGTTGSLDLKANYKLVDLGSSTLVKWTVNLNIGGMIATMGARVINSTAENYISVLTDSFRKAFEKLEKGRTVPKSRPLFSLQVTLQDSVATNCFSKSTEKVFWREPFWPFQVLNFVKLRSSFPILILTTF